MDTQRDDQSLNLLTEIERLRQTAVRLERVGLIVDRGSLSRAHRRALFALQRQMVDSPAPPEPKCAQIGFPYPNSR
jgi:hypothetical protein